MVWSTSCLIVSYSMCVGLGLSSTLLLCPDCSPLSCQPLCLCCSSSPSFPAGPSSCTQFCCLCCFPCCSLYHHSQIQIGATLELQLLDVWCCWSHPEPQILPMAAMSQPTSTRNQGTWSGPPVVFQRTSGNKVLGCWRSNGFHKE